MALSSQNPHSTQATTFTGTASTYLCGETDLQAFNGIACVTAPGENTASGANADVTTVIDIPVPDANFASIVTFYAPASTINGGPDGDLPLGTVAGRLKSQTSLGLTNNPCASDLVVDFVFMVGTNDTSNTIDHLTQAQAPPGGEGVLENLRDDNGGGIGGGSPVNKLPAHVDRYPLYLNKIFDPDFVGDINDDGDAGLGGDPGENGPAAPLTPLVRYSGSTIVSNTAVVLELVVFSPGAFSVFTAPHPFADLGDTALGYPSVVVLQDPTVPAGAGSITDFCSDLQSVTLLWGKTRDNPCTDGTAGGNAACTNDDTTCATSSPCQPRNTCINDLPTAVGCPGLVDSGVGPCTAANEAGCVRYANPNPGSTHFYSGFLISQRDADDDGIENALDTCATTATTGYDPRQADKDPTDDPDLDGIPGGGPAGGCDPQPNGGDDVENRDLDFDAGGGPWQNRGDNCPLVPNPTNLDSETTQPEESSAPRGGSRGDGIGDACDPDPNTLWLDVISNESGVLVDDLTLTYPQDIKRVLHVIPFGTATGPYAWQIHNHALNTASPCDGTDKVVKLTPVGGANVPAGVANGIIIVVETCTGQASLTVDAQWTLGGVNQGSPQTGIVNFRAYRSNGHYHAKFNQNPKCINGTDVDKDGWCDIAGTTDPLDDPDDNNANKTPEHFNVPSMGMFPIASTNHVGAGLQVCLDGIDNDGDTKIDREELDGPDTGTIVDCMPSGLFSGPDTDGDGYNDKAEVWVGTDALGRCEVGLGTDPDGGGPLPAFSGDWPSDLKPAGIPDSTDKANSSDVVAYIAPIRRLGTAPGHPDYHKGFDIEPGTSFGTAWIASGDITKLIAGATGFPAMFNNVRAFNGPVCTPHPLYGD